MAVLATACPVLFAGVAAAPALAATGTHPAVTAGTWGKAEEVPGIEALDHGFATINQMSCPTAGNCSAGGTYTDATGAQQFFVVDETNGVWGAATQLTGATVHNPNGLSFFDALSCSSAGNCSAGFNFEPFEPVNARQRVWVATETNGVWRSAIPVPGLRRLETGGKALLTGLSCTAPGDCSAGGYYVDSGRIFHPFLVNQTNGRWQTATGVPGFAALGPLNTGEVTVLSCDSPGSCSAGGNYQVGNRLILFTVAEQGGKWQQATKLPGIDSLNKSEFADFRQMSCTSPGNCSGAGIYGHNDKPLVVTETGGTWGNAQEVPGIHLAAQDLSYVGGLSCTPDGACLVVGGYDAGQTRHVYAAFEANGTWTSAKTIPKLEALGIIEVTGVSCGAPGDCSAAGSYRDSNNHFNAFVASEVNGRWVTAKEVPGSAALSAGGNASLWAVSCDAAGNCGAGGDYSTPLFQQEPFVVNQS